MGKKKDKFISGKAVTYKLVSRDLEDPNRTEENANQPVFELISGPLEEYLDDKEKKRVDYLYNVFTEAEQGIYDREAVEMEKARAESEGPSRSEILEQAKGKTGLWIHTLEKLKNEERFRNQIMEEGEYDDIQIEEGEEYDDEEDCKYEMASDDDENFEDDDEDGEETKEGEKKQKKKQKTVISLTKFNEQEEKKEEKDKNIDEVYNYDEIDYKKIKINPNIKMKKLNQWGLPADDGYDYSQHIFDDKPATGELVAVFSQKVEKVQKYHEDNDYEYEEMGADQKEVFEALDEAPDLYEDLEDDFVAMVQGNEDCIVKPEKKQKKEVKFEQKVEEKSKNIQKKKSLDKNGDQYYEEEEELGEGDEDLLMEDEEFDENEFKKAMEMYEECENEENEEANNNQLLSKNEINSVLDEHLHDMEKRKINDNIFLTKGEKEKKIREYDEQFEKDLGLLKYIEKAKKNMEDRDRERALENGEEEDEDDKKLPKFANLYPYNYKQRMKEENAAPKQIDRDQILAEQKAKYGDLIHEKKKVDGVSYADNHVMQDLMRRENDPVIEKREQDERDREFEALLEPRPLDETIATKSFSRSTVHENLNVIEEFDGKEGKRKKRNKKGKKGGEKTVDKSKINEIAEEDDEQKEDSFELNEEGNNEYNEDGEEREGENEEDLSRVKDLSSIFQKRTKAESKEERKLRKELVKEFKQQRKEKNRLFKKGFQNLVQDQNAKHTQQTQNSQNMRGVSVVQI